MIRKLKDGRNIDMSEMEDMGLIFVLPLGVDHTREVMFSISESEEILEKVEQATNTVYKNCRVLYQGTFMKGRNNVFVVDDEGEHFILNEEADTCDWFLENIAMYTENNRSYDSYDNYHIIDINNIATMTLEELVDKDLLFVE